VVIIDINMVFKLALNTKNEITKAATAKAIPTG
jgi:hypothetical protein